MNTKFNQNQIPIINLAGSGVSGLLPVGNIASGSGASSGTFLRGDGVWAAPASSGGISDGDKGDITVSSSGSIWTIDNGAVTYAKTTGLVASGTTLSINGSSYDLSANRSWTIDTSSFLTANQAITVTVTGDVSGSASGTTSITPNIFVTGIQGKPITLSTGLLRYNGSAWEWDTSTYLTGNQTITLTGDVTGSGTSSFSATIVASAVTLDKMANMATASVFYRKTAGTGSPEVQTLSTLKTDLGLTGSNSGDETQASLITKIGLATTSATGLLSDTDWDTFSGKQDALSGTGFVKSTAGTISYDTNTYLTGNQTITLTVTGDVSGSITGTTSLTPNIFVTGIQGKAITLATGFLKYNGSDWAFDSSTYLTGNQTITLTGDVTGTGATSITATIPASSIVLSKLSTSGTPSTSTYLRGDNTWATVPWSIISNPTTGQTLTMGAHRTIWNYSGTLSGNAFSLIGASSTAGIGHTMLVIENGTDSSIDLVKITSDSIRKFFIDFIGNIYVGTLTSGRVTYAGASGLLQDSANLTFDGTTLTTSGVVSSNFNRVRVTTPATSATLTIADTKTLTVNGDATITNGTHSGTNTGDQTITLSGQASGSGTSSISVTLDNTSVIEKVLTGYTAGSGTVAATDTILQAIQKLDGNDTLKVTANASISSGIFTKLTVDPKGLVTAGASATTADIADSVDRRYVSDSDLTTLANTTGENSGDQTITLTGDVSGSGTGSFATSIAASTILAKTLTGYTSGTSISAVASSDTILQGLQKIESDFNSRITYAGNSTYRVYVHDCDHSAFITTSASTVTYSAGTAGHPGTITMASPAAQYNQARFNWGQNVQTIPFWIDDFQRITWVWKYDSVTDIQGWFGIYGTTGGPTSDQNQNYSILMYVSNSTITFQSNTTGTSSLSCSTAASANTWFKCDIIRNSATSVSLWINGTLQNTFTTNVPSGQACGVGGRLMTLANPGAKTWTMDYLEMVWTPTTARY